MAELAKWTGGVKTQGAMPEIWTAPANLFDTADGGNSADYSFASATSTLTLPASNLADGYLIVARYVYDDTSGGRSTIQGRILQASGTGDFISGPAGGYCRDASEHLEYVECYAIVNNPSASSTFQFEWQEDADDATGGTNSSVFEVMPLYYSNIGMYSSDSAALYGGIVANVVTGWTTVLESDTAAIERTTDLFTVKTDDKRYLVFGSQYTVGRGGRTQRWHGLDIDGIAEEAAKAYSYYRTTSNDKNGSLFTHLLETATADRTIEQTCFRGYGILAGEGGASGDGSIPTFGDHTLVIIELNDSAEVFHTVDSVGSVNMSGAGSTFDQVLCRSGDVDIIDSASFTRQTDTQIRVNKADDYLFGANISVAQENQGTGLRWTAEVHLTKNGIEDADTRHGNYMRNSISTLGWSAGIVSSTGLAVNDDIGVSVQPIPGGEAGGEPEVQPGWSGFWGINLDTLEDTGGTTTVNNSITNEWNVKENVSEINAINWNLLSTALKAYQFDWTLLENIDSSDEFNWLIKAAISNDLDAQWKVFEQVNAGTSLNWNLLENAIKSGVLQWDIALALSTVSNSIEFDWNTLKSILKSAGINWNLIEHVDSQINYIWDTVSIINMNADFNWNINEIVNAGLSVNWDAFESILSEKLFQWNEFGTVENTSEFNWNLLEQIEKQNILQWDLINAVQSNTDLLWSLLGKPSKELNLNWNILEHVSKDSSVVWNNLTTLLNGLDVQWDLKLLATKTNEVQWEILAFVNNPIDISWNTKNIVTDEKQIQWNVLNDIQNSNSFNWGVKQNINNPIEAKWTLAENISKVGSFNWSLSPGVSRSLNTIWSISGKVSSDETLEWDVLTSLSQGLESVWQILNHVNGNSNFNWNTNEIINSAAELKWQLLKELVTTIDLNWNLSGKVNEALEAKWNILNHIESSLQSNWYITNDVGKVIQIPWSIFGNVQALNTFIWNQSGVTHKDVSFGWLLHEKLNKDANFLYNILEVTFNGLNLAWNDLVTVDENFTINWNGLELLDNSAILRWDVFTNEAIHPIEIILIESEDRTIKIMDENRIIIVPVGDRIVKVTK